MNSKHTHNPRTELEIVSQDLVFISAELEKLARLLSAAIETTKDLMDVSERRRNRIIGFLVTVYVPIAFASMRIVGCHMRRAVCRLDL